MYLYEYNDDVWQSKVEPTHDDKMSVEDGELIIFRINDGKFETMTDADVWETVTEKP